MHAAFAEAVLCIKRLPHKKSAMSMASGCDVLSARQKPLQVEDPGVVQLLTDYGKFRVEELKNGKNIPPALARRMKMLVNQESHWVGVSVGVE